MEAQKAKYDKMMKVAIALTAVVALSGFIALIVFVSKIPQGTYDELGGYIKPPHSIYTDLALGSGEGIMLGGGLLMGVPAALFAAQRKKKTSQLENLKNQITRLDTQQTWFTDSKFFEYWNTAVQQNVERLNPAKLHETLDYVHNKYEIENKKREIAALEQRSPDVENIFARDEQSQQQEKIPQLRVEIAELERQNQALFKDGLVKEGEVALG